MDRMKFTSLQTPTEIQSIKNAERAKRAVVEGSHVIHIYGQAIPLQWKKFLLCGKNKEVLLQYLYDTWKTVKMCDVHDVKVYYAHGSKWDIFYAIPSNTADQIVEVHEVLELNSTQEEADTRLYLHGAYAAKTCSNVIIMSPDTDVLVTGVSLQPLIAAHLYFFILERELIFQQLTSKLFKKALVMTSGSL